MANRVLIVDDQLISRMMIKDAATDAGWEIAGEASDGDEAVAQYRDLSPDLVTMDMVMPNLDGLAALEKILDLDPHARIVMVSAVDQKPKLARAIELGASDFIVKPVDRDRLLGMFSKMFVQET
jgi:two-component system chemotaxis response regulator CheY